MDSMEKTSSQDQSSSLGSAHDDNHGGPRNDMKPAMFVYHSASQTEVNQPVGQIPYAYFDPYMNGLYAAYAPHNMIQPQGVGAVSGRVALPVDPSEDGPIFVNAKQYHGILRRRQMRAKLEAQNKLVKTRKAYLHESRHMHALNRVRGSGGRFLSTKKTQQPDLRHVSHSQSGANKLNAPQITDDATVYQQAEDSRFSSIPTHMAVSMQGGGGGGGLMYNGNRHFASVVR